LFQVLVERRTQAAFREGSGLQAAEGDNDEAADGDAERGRGEERVQHRPSLTPQTEQAQEQEGKFLSHF
jgi:hypothetical protein